MVAVGSLVYLHLLIALLFQGMQSSLERLPSFDGRLLLPQESVQVNRRDGTLQRIFASAARACDFRVLLFYLVQYASHLELNPLQHALLALLDALPDSKDRRK